MVHRVYLHGMIQESGNFISPKSGIFITSASQPGVWQVGEHNAQVGRCYSFWDPPQEQGLKGIKNSHED